MDALFPLLIIGLVLVFLGLSLYFSRQRTQALKDLAASWGFEFCGAGNDWVDTSVWGFQLFKRGRSRRVFNLMRQRRDGVEVALFDYSYRTGSGKNSHTHHQTVVLVMDDQLNLPQFFVTPEDVFHKIGNLFGYRDIDFDSHPEFSRRYLLRGSDEDRIRKLFNYETIPFYEGRHRIYTEGFGRYLLYHSGKSLPPTQWRSLQQDITLLQQSFRKFASVR